MVRSFATFLIGSLFLIFLTNCASTSRRSSAPFRTRLYVGSYDEVWLAALKALGSYPLKISNKDIGRISTEVINGPYNELLFAYPDPIKLPERFRYSLSMSFAKLEDEADQPLVRIRVIKELEKYQDFYTGWVSHPTDGLEEKVLLYRVEHLLKMDQLLTKQGY